MAQENESPQGGEGTEVKDFGEKWKLQGGDAVKVPSTISDQTFVVTHEDERNEHGQRQYTVALGNEVYKLPWYLLRKVENPGMVQKHGTPLQ